jgi:hypothetical protein
MMVDQARAMFSGIAENLSDLNVEVGTRKTPPHEFAYLKISDPANPSEFAVIRTPGERWFFVDVSSGFGATEVDEDLSDTEIRSVVERQVRVATSYVLGDYDLSRSRILRRPVLAVRTVDGVVTLSRSQGSRLRQFE